MYSAIRRVPVSINGLLVERNKPHIVARKPVAEIIALIAIVAKAPDQVLDNHAVDFTFLDVRQEPLEVFAFFVRRAAHAIVNIFVNVNVFVAVVLLFEKVGQDKPLMGNAFRFVFPPFVP